MQPIAILASGMVTAVGLDARSSCAAIRCAIDNFSETRFMDKGGEWIIGSQVPLREPWQGLPKLIRMVVPAIRECLASVGDVRPVDIPLLLCVAELERAGRLEGLDEQLFDEIQSHLGLRFHSRSALIARGRVAGALALAQARNLINDEQLPFCIIAGVDSYLVSETIVAFEQQDRVLTSQNSNGFIPGEAGAAVLIGPGIPQAGLICHGIGMGQEKATITSEEPFRADGLVEALKAAFAEAQDDFACVDYRLTSANGEQYWFKEAALAMSRALRTRKEDFDIWHPADCIGETGAASAPCAFGVALTAARKGYAPGPGALCHFGADDGQRTAVIFRRSQGS